MDIRLYFREMGAGEETLILLHGNGEDGAYFEKQMSFFAPYYRVIAIDSRGHGKTPRGEKPLSIRRFAADLLGFMDDQNIDKAHLLGFSDGGNVALCFALENPRRVGKLILNGANLDAKGVKAHVQIPIELGYRVVKRCARRSDEAKAKAELLGLMVNDPNIAVAELKKMENQTLVIAGTRDMIKRRHTEKIAAAIAGAELSFIDGDHFIAAKNSDAFNERVLSFLRKGEDRYDEKM